ncbi:3-hydroxyacyl-CoA dehydrogenase NAD-binding domain-containing protein [Blastopirellula sp. JC732]|uniref:enoyl-CoA hydratase n=1 Tax=Blastopirellula sediminis TaxID=2894196 RepID=A0A9X1ML60_9BACT|nr:3-hydroxyacyl-CoA dehydrogenase NAD-binding domain-containing protein [Blastopirellula sediminis]MCC9609695.1 3-hydroxyacyl-CoA dehydrogenase NAD-binding domain-containing protein [Blastopirellula sediminis]MCC9627529.1 3-hydroxyacyl-CoA dehydrogenase NAD-binding domain-containing protein [Blastopirellula sediminis]
MLPTATIELSFPQAGIALLTFNDPSKGANILSRSVMDELAKHLDEIDGCDDIYGLVIASGKPGIFIAGADIREFVASVGASKEEIAAMSQRGQQLFARLSSGRYMSVAAIDGVCVGGGAELAVWCDRRILSTGPKTELGFPEVKLGIFPGWGGTVRLPRIVGLSNAVEMITGGESVTAAAAAKMGLADDVTSPDDLVAAAIRMIEQEKEARSFLQDREKRSSAISLSETEFGFLGATASAYIQGQTKGQYPAPLAALETLLGGAMMDAASALEMEAQGLAGLFGTPVNAALMNVFFLTDRNKKDVGVENSDVEKTKIDSVSVIGAGIMGAGIAAANIRRGVYTTMADANAEALRRGVAGVLDEASYDREAGKKTVAKAIEGAALLNGSSSDAEITSANLVIEAIVENMEVKRKIYARLEPLMADDAILASNTSTLPITQLAANLAKPERFVGIHFFNPVRKMKLVEVIRGEKTSDATVASAVAYAKRLGKFPIVVNDGPGFLVNRLLFPYMNESLALLQEGVSMERIDKCSKKFGMPIGPIALYDMVGIDTAFYAGRTMYDAFPDRTLASPILPALVKAGRLGNKSGRGFYNYENRKGKAEPDPTAAKYIDPYIRGTPRDETDAQLTDRLFLPMLLEATRAMEAKIVRDVRDIDLGLIFGLGFPPFKGGLMFWADTVGAAKLVERLKPWEDFGVRYKPTDLLLEMAKSGKKFYDL